MPPLTNRLHSLVGRLSHEGGYIVAQADVAEAVARIVQLERALGELLSHLDHVGYVDGGSRLGDATSVVSNAKMVLGKTPPAKRCRMDDLGERGPVQCCRCAAEWRPHASFPPGISVASP